MDEGHLQGADGVRLFYRRLGEGGDIAIFVHGGPGSNFRGPDHELAPLAVGRTLVFYDQRGGGGSDLVSAPERLKVADHLRDLDAVRSHFRAERVTLIGLSWGAGLAALYAAERPDNVAKLVLISPIPPRRSDMDARIARLNGLLGRQKRARRDELRAAIASAADDDVVSLCRELSDLTFALYLARPTPGALAEAARRCDIAPAAIRNRPVVEAAGLASLGDWDFTPQLRQVRAPTLVLEGERSNVPLEPTRAFAAAIAGARLALIPDAGHEVFVDQPEAFVATVSEFLSGPDPQSLPR